MKVDDLNSGVLWLGATDTLGKRWAVPKRQLRKLIAKEEANRMVKAGRSTS